MGYSKLIITFNDDIKVDESLSFSIDNSESTSPFVAVHQFIWVGIRTGKRQVQVGLEPTDIAGEISAINFINAFQIDLNSTDNYNVSRNDNVVTIESLIPELSFENTSYITDPLLISSLPVIDFDLDNFTGDVFKFNDLDFLEATENPACTHYKVSLQTSIITDRITGSYSLPTGNTDNPVVFELMRGEAFNLNLFSEDGQEINLVYGLNQVPSRLNSSKFNFVITNSPAGGTVVINNEDLYLLNLEYSLDNTTWQSENEFSGLFEGDYTIYIRDHLGCSFSETFSIDGVSLRVPYFKMPKSNAIRYANRVTWDDCANYKTDENTLCHETEDVEEPKGYIQDWQSCDVIPTQFRTSYRTRTATLIKTDGTEVDLPISKMTSNMGLKNSRDARKYDLGEGKTGLYFLNGNLYDFDTGIDSGDDYVLNGLLPDWAQAGNYVKVDDVWFLIEDTITDEDKNAQVIVYSSSYTGEDVAVIAGSVYNLENYEEYEYTIDMASYIDDCFSVQLVCEDASFTTITQLSEQQHVAIVKPGTIEIKYKNSSNTDVNFSRGLEYTLRFLREKVSAKIDDETEVNKTDTSAYLSESEIHEVDDFLFSPLPKQIMYLLLYALSHDTVSINGVSYVKAESLNVDGPLESTNLYEVTASMLKLNSAFNTNLVVGSPTVSGSDIEIPGLIEHDDGFVKY